MTNERILRSSIEFLKFVVKPRQDGRLSIATKSMAKRARGRPLVKTLTYSQERMLNAIEMYIDQSGMSPTMRELADQLDKGVASVFKSIERLERNGFITRMPGKSRSLAVIRSARETPLVGLVSIPLLGTVAAGAPMFALENRLGELLVESGTVRAGRYFALKVSGESMIDAGICSGDLLIVRHQPLADHRDIVVALLNDEATVKRLHNRNGQVQLLPENKKFQPIVVGPEDDLKIVGKVVAFRKAPKNTDGHVGS